jgi:hypothetical protein
MADYYPLVAKAIYGLDSSAAGESRYGRDSSVIEGNGSREEDASNENRNLPFQIKLIGAEMVGTTGIEPVTPTMSR